MLNKRFLILGNGNYVGCKKIFPLFKDNKVWLGISVHSGNVEFCANNCDISYASYKRIDGNGNKYIKVGGIRWFTNLGNIYRPKPLDLRGNYYSPEKYPKYDNYNAINVDKVADIPCDYAGVMGVPLTFMDKYNPEQFEILGINSGNNDFSKEAWPTKKYINAIQHNVDGKISKGNSINTSSTIVCNETNGTYYTADNQPNKMKKIFSRILIRNKNPVVK